MKTLGLIGFGRAGKAVARVFNASKDHQLSWVFKQTSKGIKADPDEWGSTEFHSQEDISLPDLIAARPVDFIVDFSSPETIHSYGETAAELEIKIISAVSSYPEKTIEYLKELARKTVVFWSPNITLGVNFLMVSARLLRDIAPEADVQIIEEHFKDKKDTSGTALKIARKLGIGHSAVKSIRVGGIVGKHEVVFGFPYQTVRIIHESIGREAFGNGSLFAIRRIEHEGYKRGFFTFEDLLLPYFNFNHVTEEG